MDASAFRQLSVLVSRQQSAMSLSESENGRQCSEMKEHTITFSSATVSATPTAVAIVGVAASKTVFSCRVVTMVQCLGLLACFFTAFNPDEPYTTTLRQAVQYASPCSEIFLHYKLRGWPSSSVFVSQSQLHLFLTSFSSSARETRSSFSLRKVKTFAIAFLNSKSVRIRLSPEIFFEVCTSPAW
ncbi:hypothetical protein BaRGS_00037469 [Batillaria attramentaria]|uniref:Uncharacterized protein n=1 Tax=Batillaria attramentaria TaxID=370345 RepID=A0ABD0J8M1_9CAEN